MTSHLRRLAWALPCCAVIVLYWQVRNHGFIHFDDMEYTYDNLNVVGGLSWSGVQWAFSGSHAANYHPLTWLSHMLDYEVFGPSPGAFALENACWHAANSLLVAILFARLFASRTTGIVVGLVFAIHPQLVEAVAWISQRKTLLATFFALISMLLYLRAPRPGPPRTRWLPYGGSLIAFTLSLLAKGMYVTLPGILLLLNAIVAAGEAGTVDKTVGTLRSFGLPLNRGALRHYLLLLGPFAILAILASWLTVWAQSSGGAVQDLVHHPIADRLATAAHGYVWYLQHFLCANGLSVFYPPLSAWTLGGVAGNLGLLFGITLALFVVHRRLGPVPLFGWLLFVGSLIPVIGLVQVGDQSTADRYMYGPVLGLLVAATSLAQAVASTPLSWAIKRALPVAFVGWLSLTAVSAHRQIQQWRNSTTLALASMANVGACPQLLCMQVGELLKAGRYGEALRPGRLSVQLAPQHLTSIQNLAVAEFASGNTESGITWCRRYAELAPNSPHPHVNLAIFLLKLGRWEEARNEVLAARSKGALTPSEIHLLDDVEKKTGEALERPSGEKK